jgi:hypothetical protein
MNRRETYRRRPTLWDMIPGWAYGIFFIALFAQVIYMNWGW